MIETKTEDYKSHKHEYNVYVKINSKTKLGQDLLEQYHKQAQKQYIDIGRLGYHDKYGRYIIDHYSLFELVAIPKLIISVTEQAIDRAGRDIYKLRTYMSKFGQLNFLLLVDRSNAELILVENVFIENLNHRENYETPIYKLRYSPNKPVPLKEIFYKFGVRANPEDYGKAFKKEEASINNLIVAKAKAEMTIKLANTIASDINQKALLTSLNYLNKEGTYGKNVTKEYSKKVAKSKELNELSTSPKLENTLNNVLVKTLEQQTTKADVKDKTNFKLYKKVLDVELSSHSEVKKEVNKLNNKQHLKEFLLDTYQKRTNYKEDEENLNEEKFKTFEKIIEKQYSINPSKEITKPIEEDFKPQEIEINPKEDYFDFNNKKINIDFNVDRFNKKEDPNKKQINKQLEKLEKKKEKKEEKLFKIQNKNSKVFNAECNLDEEFEKSKLTLGILPTDSKRKRKKALNLFFSDDKKKQNKKVKNEKLVSEGSTLEQDNKISIIEKIEKQIRSQKINMQKKKNTKELNKVSKQKEKKKKTNANTLTFDDTTINKKTALYKETDNPVIAKKGVVQDRDLFSINSKTNQSSVIPNKTGQSSKKQDDEKQQVNDNYSAKQEILENIKKKKTNKIIQDNLQDEIDTSKYKKQKTTKSATNTTTTEEYKETSETKNITQRNYINTEEITSSKKCKPQKDLGREM